MKEFSTFINVFFISWKGKKKKRFVDDHKVSDILNGTKREIFANEEKC